MDWKVSGLQSSFPLLADGPTMVTVTRSLEQKLITDQHSRHDPGGATLHSPLHVEDCSEGLLAPVILCHKEPAQASKAPYYTRSVERKKKGLFACPFLVLYGIMHKGAYNRSFLCMEANYPMA